MRTLVFALVVRGQAMHTTGLTCSPVPLLQTMGHGGCVADQRGAFIGRLKPAVTLRSGAADCVGRMEQERMATTQ